MRATVSFATGFLAAATVFFPSRALAAQGSPFSGPAPGSLAPSFSLASRALAPVGVCAAAGKSRRSRKAAAAAPESNAARWGRFLPEVGRQQKRIWLFPRSLAEGRHWLPFTAFVLGTGGLIALDQYDAPYFRRTTRFHTFNNTLTGINAVAGMAIVPGALYAIAHFRHDGYMERTIELAGEAVLDSEALNLVLRDVSRRLPPRDIPANGNFADTFFDRHVGLFYVGPGGFPSGHTIGAVSLATIFARRYRRHRWVPWLAYGLAGVVGFSRMTRSDHFPSDVFAGAFLGYVIGRFAILRNH
jgi:membrane-associated phospholipid phosphatase